MGTILKERIPNFLRKHRRVRGFNQADVARILNLKSTSMISRWENGVCLPSALNLFRLAALYRTMVESLYLDFLKIIRDDAKNKEELVQNPGPGRSG